jgi:hypothetical protein
MYVRIGDLYLQLARREEAVRRRIHACICMYVFETSTCNLPAGRRL